MEQLICAACGQPIRGKSRFWAYDGDSQKEVGPDCHQRLIDAGESGINGVVTHLWPAKYDPEDFDEDALLKLGLPLRVVLLGQHVSDNDGVGRIQEAHSADEVNFWQVRVFYRRAVGRAEKFEPIWFFNANPTVPQPSPKVKELAQLVGEGIANKLAVPFEYKENIVSASAPGPDQEDVQVVMAQREVYRLQAADLAGKVTLLQEQLAALHAQKPARPVEIDLTMQNWPAALTQLREQDREVHTFLVGMVHQMNFGSPKALAEQAKNHAAEIAELKQKLDRAVNTPDEMWEEKFEQYREELGAAYAKEKDRYDSATARAWSECADLKDRLKVAMDANASLVQGKQAEAMKTLRDRLAEDGQTIVDLRADLADARGEGLTAYADLKREVIELREKLKAGATTAPDSQLADQVKSLEAKLANAEQIGRGQQAIIDTLKAEKAGLSTTIENLKKEGKGGGSPRVKELQAELKELKEADRQLADDYEQIWALSLTSGRAGAVAHFDTAKLLELLKAKHLTQAVKMLEDAEVTLPDIITAQLKLIEGLKREVTKGAAHDAISTKAEIGNLRQQVKRLEAENRKLQPAQHPWFDAVLAFIEEHGREPFRTWDCLSAIGQLGETDRDLRAAQMELGKVMRQIGGWKKTNNIQGFNQHGEWTLVRGWMPIDKWEA